MRYEVIDDMNEVRIGKIVNGQIPAREIIDDITEVGMVCIVIIDEGR